MNYTKNAGYAVVMFLVFVVLFAGCVSSPEKGTPNQSVPVKEMSNQSVPVKESQGNVRYVQLNFLDGTSAGGKYVSETAAFTTIQYMYLLKPGYADVTISTGGTKTVDYPEITNESGATVSFKNTLINTMVDIENPTQVFEKVKQERETVENADKVGRAKLGWPPSPLNHY